MKGFVISQTYKILHGKPYVCLFGRLENGESFLTLNHFKPYFYIKKENVPLTKEEVAYEVEETSLKNFKGEKVVKIILDLPTQVPLLKKKFEDKEIECYEADIRFPYRFMMDKGIQGSLNIEGEYESLERIDRIYKEPEISSAQGYIPKNIKILSFDLESGKNEDEDELYCIGLMCGNIKKVFLNTKEKVEGAISCDGEEEVIEKFIQEVLSLDPDVITGWNIINFDLAYLYKKCKKLNINFDLGRERGNCKIKIEENFFRESKAEVSGRQVLDGLNLLKLSFIKVEDYKLDTVAKTILGEGKLIHTTGVEKYKEIEDLFKNNKKKLIEYNLKDAELVLRILEKTKVLELTILRSTLTGMPLDRVNASIASLDSLYIREAKNKGIVVPTGKYVVKDEGIKGGYVREGQAGIYDYILVLDFKSLYPSIIRTFNIDPYSFVPDTKGKNLIKAPNGACFRNEEGILPNILTKLYHEREKARKNKDELTRYAIKILSNSFFGVIASPSCRFFDLNIANAITNFGQEILKLTQEEIKKQGYGVIYGDSITKERYVTLLINNILSIKNIEELFNDYNNNIEKREDKEVINLSSYKIKALTVNKRTLKPEFSILNEIIRHKVNKKVYRINQKYGETICTQDHSIMILEDNKLKEVKPKDLNNKQFIQVKYITPLKKLEVIDLYKLLKNYSFSKIYKGKLKIADLKLYDKKYILFGWMTRKKPILLKRYIKVGSKDFEALCRILGFYIAEGASSTPETTKSRLGATIANSNKRLLNQLKKDYYKLFKNAKISIIRSTLKKRNLTYFNNNKKFNTIYEDKTHKLQMMNALSAVFFKILAGQTSKFKKLPEFIYHVEDKYKKILLEYMILGDGNRRESDVRYSKKYKKINFSYTTSSLNLVSGLSFLLNQLDINYSIQYRPSKKAYTMQTSSKNNVRLHTKIKENNYEGYVYDLNVEDNHMFVDSCGQILLHNTDSNFVISKAKNLDEADKIGKKIQNHINNFYKDLVKKEYNRESFLELNYEKCFIKFLMPKLRGKEAGAKKRYAGLVLKEGKEELQVTGMEAIRGDWTALAKKYQTELLDRVFHNKDVVEFTKKFVKDINAGKYDELLVYKKSIRKDLKEYVKSTPPHVKAARKMTTLDSTKIEYVITEEGPEPIQNVKHNIDYKHYIDKQIKPIADAVLVFFNTNFEDLMKGSKQTSLGNF